MPFDSIDLRLTEIQQDLHVLRRARNKIACPGAWSKHTMGFDRHAHCALGWICAVNNGNHGGIVSRHFTPLLGTNTLISYNDAPNTKQADIVALFDRAIANIDKIHVYK